ncbi:MAG: glycosyltransferase [Gemmatimonadaceae bacterium]
MPARTPATAGGEGAMRPGRLRVVYCLDSFDVGGTELNAIRTIEQIDRDQFDVSFVALSNRGSLAERVRAAGVPIHEFPIRSLVSPDTVRTGLRLARFLRAQRADVLHAHDIYSNIFAVPWARVAGVPLVIASRRWWHAVVRPIHLRMNRLTYRMAHRVLANSESVGRLVEEEGVPPGRVVVLPNFVEDYAFEPPAAEQLALWRRELGLGEGDEVVGIVANLHPVKDHASLLRAVALVAPRRPSLRLVLVGDGSERTALESLAGELGIGDRVRFAGRRPQRPTMHGLFDVSVLSSLGEGFPNSIVEAMAAGRPLVATAVGGVVDVVEHARTGLLVPPGVPAEMAAGIERLLSNPAEAGAMGRAGRERARTVFHADTVMARLADLYKRGP